MKSYLLVLLLVIPPLLSEMLAPEVAEPATTSSPAPGAVTTSTTSTPDTPKAPARDQSKPAKGPASTNQPKAWFM
ncbi:MAG: hypothetical protein JSR48_16035 [Verrucomicrobia bacterium]|nr:hypothetical protein [Verrucomicrobiota bacterium]